MNTNTFSFSEFKFSSPIIRDLVSQKEGVKPFIHDFFSSKNIDIQIKQKNFNTEQREILVNVLNKQNESIKTSDKTTDNIKSLLNTNTYTITTGHQLNLLTGPLYSIYKILQVIIWTEKLNEKYNTHHFVPVFWMATEDHDFEEINHIYLFNQKFEWQKQGQDNYIAGAIETDSSFEQNFAQPIIDLFKDESLNQKVKHYLSFYKNTNLSNATRLLLNDLFGSYGLVIIDGNDKQLKASFQPVIEKELTEKLTYHSVSDSNKKLIKSGYHNQVFLRECNLFYIENQKTRHRIIKTDKGYEINGTLKTDYQLVEESKQYPERFSPNALLRPVYQEMVLPNLTYIGGGGEIAYWLQLKGVFDKLNLTFPLLRVRDSYVLLNTKQIKQLDTLGVSVLDLKQDYDDLIKSYVKNNTTINLSLSTEKESISSIKNSILNKIDQKDIGLNRFIESELVKMNHQLNKIEKKLLQNEKKKQTQTLQQIKKLRDKVYPNNGFQERYENILQYIHNPNFIDTLKKELDQTTIDQAQIFVFEV